MVEQIWFCTACETCGSVEVMEGEGVVSLGRKVIDAHLTKSIAIRGQDNPCPSDPRLVS